MKRIFGTRLQKKEQKRILLAGTQTGVGTTHFALSLANVFASKERRRTLYMEIGKNGSVATLRTAKTFEVFGLVGFRMHGVYYLPQISGAQAERLLCGSEWDVAICDVTEAQEAEMLFSLVDRRLVLCNLKPWHYSAFQQSMNTLIRKQNEKRVELCSFNLQQTDENRCRGEFGLRVAKLPDVGNPFRMTHEEAAAVARFADIRGRKEMM